jgi:ribosomal protein S18 acetylase RimI-like enzyme
VLNIRTATKDDLEFLLSLAPRLSEMGLPPFRQEEALQAFTRDLLQKTLETQADSFILIAEQEGKHLGFIHLEEDKEFFSGKPHGYIANLAITKEAEGKGVGRALMSAAESWAKEKGFAFMSLFVFATNQHARAFYEKLGYEEDSLRLTKQL